MKLVFDIETVGFDFDSLHESQQEFLLRYVEKEKDENIKTEKREEAIRFLSLYPYTAKVVAIGMLNTKTDKSMILFEGNENEHWTVEDKQIEYKALKEDKIISTFWDYVIKADQVITFNGRNFDIPFLMLRSALLKIKPSINLIKNRYDSSKHIDLLEQLTFYGLTRKFNLDFYCQSLGIDSPKSKGITGMDVKELFNAGRIKDIAIYCGEDVKSTYELYKIWNEYLNL